MAAIMSYEEFTRCVGALKASFPQQFAVPPIGISVYPGWLSLFEKLCADIDQVEKEHGAQRSLRWRQVKEKFGALRAYCGVEPSSHDNGLIKVGGKLLLRAEDEPNSNMHVQSQWTRVSALVDATENASGTTCMFCGAPGTLRNNDRMFTACEAHGRVHLRDYFL